MAQMLVEQAQAQGATKDCDFPEFALYNLPFRGMDQNGIGDILVAKSELLQAIRQLDWFRCSHVLIACNTLHVFLEEVRPHTGATLLNMVALAAGEAARQGGPVGVLSSRSTKEHKLYEKALADLNVDAVATTEEEQGRVDTVIGAVMAGKAGHLESEAVENILHDMVRRGARRAILGCTELEAALFTGPTELPVIDAGEVAVKAALEALRG
jgi:aspartate/glutamate racemase